MAKAREQRKNGQGPKQVTFSSGVTVDMLPFPAGLWEEVNTKAFQDYPDPIPPKKTITVLGGTEEVDDLENEDYKAEVEKVKGQRAELLLRAILDICPQLDLSAWEGKIRRIEVYSPKFSNDPEDRKIEFLTRYVIRTDEDYTELMISAIEQTMIKDPEVADRIRYFRREMERATHPDLDAPGPA
jgi:hypothetical protein